MLTVPEQVLYFRLLKALPDHIVLAQVGMTRVIGLPRGAPVGHLNAIRAKSLDFVLCTKNARPIAVIELDDSSHAKPDRARADRLKDAALAAAGVPIVRFNAANMPAVEELRAHVLASPDGADAEGRREPQLRRR